MTGRRRARPSRAPVRGSNALTGLVLYRTPTQWQFAISAGGGIVDGHLAGVPLEADEGDAQAALLDLIEQWTGRVVEARWRTTGPGWWAADASYAR